MDVSLVIVAWSSAAGRADLIPRQALAANAPPPPFPVRCGMRNVQWFRFTPMATSAIREQSVVGIGDCYARPDSAPASLVMMGFTEMPQSGYCLPAHRDSRVVHRPGGCAAVLTGGWRSMHA